MADGRTVSINELNSGPRSYWHAGKQGTLDVSALKRDLGYRRTNAGADASADGKAKGRRWLAAKRRPFALVARCQGALENE
jgi:hypothetical protein